MNITAEELIDLMFLPMSDERVIETIDNMGLEQPIIDEKYEIEEYVSVGEDSEYKIGLIFSEPPSEYKSYGEPVLDQIDFEIDGKVRPPFNLDYDDDYKTCCEKIGKKADYYSDNYGTYSRKWVFTNKRGEKYSLNVHFRNKELDSIEDFVLGIFSTENIGTLLFENKE